MEQPRLGRLPDSLAERDAVHIAVAPVIASEALKPGQHVALVDGEAVQATQSVRAIGIVDSYLTKPVAKGERFWLMLYPGSITSLRHDWTHKAFAVLAPRPGGAELSLLWLHEFANRNGRTYEEIIRAAVEHWVPSEGIDVPEEFWLHYEAATGAHVSESQRTDYFSCSC